MNPLKNLLDNLKVVDWEEAYKCNKFDKNYNIVRNCISALSENPSKKKVDMYSVVLLTDVKDKRETFTIFMEEVLKFTRTIPVFRKKDLSKLGVEEQAKLMEDFDKDTIEKLKTYGDKLRVELVKILPYLTEENLKDTLRICRSIHAVAFPKEELDSMVSSVLSKMQKGTGFNEPVVEVVMTLLNRPRPKFHTISYIERQIVDFYSNGVLFADEGVLGDAAELLFTVHCLETIGSCDFGKLL